MSLFHMHKWRLVSVGQYTRSFLGSSGSDITLVLYKCSGCGAHRTQEIDGHWTKEELS